MAATLLTDSQITEQLRSLPGWERHGDSIAKTYTFDSYLSGVAFAAAAGTVAEGLDHHPEMTISWRKVTVRFSTHDAGDKITSRDFRAAEAIEALGYPKVK